MSRRFQTTRWSLVLEAAGNRPGADEALEWLCRTYWYPLYGYIRADVRDSEKARDLTQAYFLRVLEKDYLKQIDPSAGKFRSFLLATLKHFLSHERERERALKRRADDPALALPVDAEDRYLKDATAVAGDERAFDRRWAFTVLENAMTRLADGYTAEGKGDLYRVLGGYLTGRGTARPYDEAARELGMAEGAVRVAVHRMRKRLGTTLREEVAQTVAGDEDVDQELRYLLSVLGDA
jgi:RNA polymerase sigma-70 factor (ECF subfamily)